MKTQIWAARKPHQLTKKNSKTPRIPGDFFARTELVEVWISRVLTSR